MPELLRRNQHTDSASESFFLLLLLLLREQYVPPATEILWNEGTDGLSFPNVLQNTTDYRPSADLCGTGCLSDKNRRTESQKSDERRDAPAVHSVHHVLPTLLPVQILLRDLFLSAEEIPE